MVKILKVLGTILKILVKIASVLPRNTKKTEPVFSFFRYFLLEKRKNEKLVFSYCKTKKSDPVFFPIEKNEKKKVIQIFHFFVFCDWKKRKRKKNGLFFSFFFIYSLSDRKKNEKLKKLARAVHHWNSLEHRFFYSFFKKRVILLVTR